MTDTRITDWTLPGSDGQTIYGNTHHPSTPPRGVLVCAHGFKGYKDYGFFPTLCDHAAGAGLIAHRFNFSHSGMTNRIDTFERPDLFEKDRWGRQVEDLGHVFAALADGTISGGSLPRVLFGHSRGGVSALLYASRNRALLSGLITAAAPDDACRLDDLAKEQLRLEGRLLSPSGRTGQDLYVGRDWLDEIEREPAAFDPVTAARRIDCPLLTLHGTADPTVPHTSAESLHAASPTSRLELIDGASHTFDCPNPVPSQMLLEQLPDTTQRMIQVSVEFALQCCC